jgi:SAM-dependent methyltransferase
MRRLYDPNRPVGFESRKSYAARCASGFWDRFLPGPVVVDVGYRGGIADAVPIVDGAVGIERGSPEYNGFNLPFNSGSVDSLYASHVIEHLLSADAYLKEWFRVLREGGFMVLAVPHAHLYERRLTVPPSRWSPEHLAAYSPASLLWLVETALKPNSYRIRFFEDNDAGYDYSLPIDAHPVGCLEMTLVLEKRRLPEWSVEP